MNLTNLTYFIAAAEELNFTRAARRLYISQQALSSHIAKLEEYYQVPLFDRGNPMTLTDAGRVLYQSAVQVTETLELCDRRLQDIKDFTRGSLSVGIPVTRGTMMLPQLCSAFHQLYPKVHLEIFEGQTTPEVEQALAAGKIDLEQLCRAMGIPRVPPTLSVCRCTGRPTFWSRPTSFWPRCSPRTRWWP